MNSGRKSSRMCWRVCFCVRKCPPGSHGRDRIQRQRFVIHHNALHRLVNDGEDLAVHHHLGIGPDAAAVQETQLPAACRTCTMLAMKVERLFSMPACQFGSLAPVANEPIESGMS